jgi:plastocyanin
MAGLVVAAVLGGACGDSKGGTSGSGTGTQGEGEAPVTLASKANNHGTADARSKGALEVEADDYYFGPTYIHAKAGQSIELELVNQGKASHTFTTEDGKADEQLAPGAKKKVTVTAPATGLLVYYCRFHRGDGMQGAVYLKDGDKQAADTGTTPTSAGGYGY